MNPKSRSKLIMLNSCLLICGLIFAGGLALKTLPGNDAQQKEYRERIEQSQDIEFLRKKVLASNDYVLTLEQLVKQLRLGVICTASAAAIFGAMNLIIICKKERSITTT